MVKAYAVVGTTKDKGRKVVLKRFPPDEHDGAIQFALGVDMDKLDDVVVRPIAQRLPRPPEEFRPPFTLEHRETFSRMLDADGRVAAHFLGRNPVRERFATLAATLLTEAPKGAKL